MMKLQSGVATLTIMAGPAGIKLIGDGNNLGRVQFIGTDFLTELRATNSRRYLDWVGENQLEEDAAFLFDATELAGEVGELVNVVKKLVREKVGWAGSRAGPSDFEDECADVLICLDRLASRVGIDLREATIRKFNATSEKVGLHHRLYAGEDIQRVTSARGAFDPLDRAKLIAAYPGPVVSFDVEEGYYLASCDDCGWVGSSQLCGTDKGQDDSSVYCPRCHSSGADCGKVAELIPPNS